MASWKPLRQPIDSRTANQIHGKDLGGFLPALATLADDASSLLDGFYLIARPFKNHRSSGFAAFVLTTNNGYMGKVFAYHSPFPKAVVRAIFLSLDANAYFIEHSSGDGEQKTVVWESLVCRMNRHLGMHTVRVAASGALQQV